MRKTTKKQLPELEAKITLNKNKQTQIFYINNIDNNYT